MTPTSSNLEKVQRSQYYYIQKIQVTTNYASYSRFVRYVKFSAFSWKDINVHKDPAQSFFSTRLSKSYHVLSLFDTSANAIPSSSQDYAYVIEVDVSSTTLMTEADITDITSLSPQWRCHALSERYVCDHPIHFEKCYWLWSRESSPSGTYRFLLGASPWPEGQASQDVYDCVLHNMTKFLKGIEVDLSLPSPIDLLCSHISKVAVTY